MFLKIFIDKKAIAKSYRKKLSKNKNRIEKKQAKKQVYKKKKYYFYKANKRFMFLKNSYRLKKYRFLLLIIFIYFKELYNFINNLILKIKS